MTIGNIRPEGGTYEVVFYTAVRTAQVFASDEGPYTSDTYASTNN